MHKKANSPKAPKTDVVHLHLAFQEIPSLGKLVAARTRAATKTAIIVNNGLPDIPFYGNEETSSNAKAQNSDVNFDYESELFIARIRAFEHSSIRAFEHSKLLHEK